MFDDTLNSDTAPLPESTSQRPLTITELTQKIRRLLETQVSDVLVEGEVSGFKGAASGHIYFDLKDSGALIKCVIWAADAARLKYRPEDGAKIEARGRLTVYDLRGQYQLRVVWCRPAGLGKLYQAFLDMKERLAGEGLFDSARKRPLPPHPKRIGIVTSPTGAAIRDMVNILTRRAPHIHILIWPARVQGEGAAGEVASAIEKFNQLEPLVDVLIVGRGGGSLEDLWAFNEEPVARAIFSSAIPVISAVGHETDTTIADFVADLRAPTPSAAAELVARDSSDLLQHLAVLQNRAYRALREQSGFLRQTPHLISRLESAVFPRLQMMRGQLKEFERSYGIQLPLQRINLEKQNHDDLLERMNRSVLGRLNDSKVAAVQYGAQLRTLNPKGILKRGYSITYNLSTDRIVSKASEAEAGSPLKIVLGTGELSAEVTGARTVRRSKSQSSKSRDPKILDWFGAEPSDIN